MPIIEDGFINIVSSPAEDRLAYAVELCLLSRSTEPKDDVPASMEHRRVTSSAIIHVVAALDAFLNRFGHEAFFDSSAEAFVAPSTRSAALNRFVAGWRNASVVDRTAVLAETVVSTPVPPNLLARCREVVLLRNWLVHGQVYEVSALLDSPDGESGSGAVIDYEESVDWRAKFPHMKLEAMLLLQRKHAEFALEVVSEALRHLANPFLKAVVLYFSYPDEQFVVIDGPDISKEVLYARALRGNDV